MSSPKAAIITEAVATGEELGVILDQVEPILMNYPTDHGIIVCLMMAATMMNPYADADEIQDAVLQTSQFLCLALDGKGGTQIVGSSKETMN